MNYSVMNIIISKYRHYYTKEWSDALVYILLSFSVCTRYQNCFHGVDLCQLREQALNEYLRQPIVDTFDIGICLAKSIRYSLDFITAQEKDLHHLGKLLLLEKTTVIISSHM